MINKIWGWMSGLKTYSALLVILIHQIAKANGYDVGDAETSAVVDAVLAAIAALGRFHATVKKST